MTTHVTFLLDETGSMGTMKAEVISGFNKYIEDLSRDGNDYVFSLTKFDSAKTVVVHDGVPIQQVLPLNEDTYRPGASTPLYDAIASVITRGGTVHAERTLMVIYTDGEENASHEWTLSSINTLMKSMEQAHWTFMYLGASPEAWKNEHILAGLGSVANNFRASGRGAVGQTMAAASATTSAYAATQDFVGGQRIVTDEDKEAVRKASGQ